MRKISPTVKPLIEALQLADAQATVDGLEWSELAAWVHPGTETSDRLTGRRARPASPPPSRGALVRPAPLLLA